MATISQRISLEGADDIKKKLQDLGKAGEQAFKQIQDAAAKPITDPARIEQTKQAFDNLTVAAREAGDAIQKAGQQGASGLAQTTAAANNLAVRIGVISGVVQAATSKVLSLAGSIGGLFGGLISQAGETAQQISDQADKLGLTTEQWIALRRAIDAAGGSTEEFANSIAPLMQGLNQLTTAGKSITTFADGAQVAILSTARLTPQLQQLQDVLLKFGVRRDIIDRGSVAVLQELARIIDGMPEGVAKAAAGIQFFGEKWRDVVESLTIGAKSVGDAASELDNMRRASREMLPEQQKDAKAANDAWKDLGNAIRAAKEQIGAFLAPQSGARAKWLADMVDDARMLMQTWSRADEIARASFLANPSTGPAQTAFKVLIILSQQLARVWSEVLVPIAQTLFSTMAEGQTPQWMNSLIEGGKQLAAQLPDILNTIGNALKGLGGIADSVAGGVNAVFGTKFTGAGLAALLVIGQVTGALKTLELTIAIVALAMVAFNNTVGLVNASLTLAKSVFSALTFAAGLLATAIRGLGTAMMLLAANPWSILIIAAIVAIGVAILLLIKYWPQIKQAAADAADAIAAKWQELKNLFNAWVTTPIGNAWQWIKDTFWDAVGGIKSVMDTVTAWIRTWVTTPIANAWQWIVDKWNAMLKALGFGGGEAGGAPAGAGGIGHAARGGLLGGRGTGTSDSNLAWVSRGEHIMPAHAVRQPGVLAFLEALRRSGGDLTRVLDGLGRFATGGLVTMPALAGGGLGGMSHVTIQFPGLPAISGLRASSDVVDELRKAAALAQVRSGGRKPSRYT